MTSPVTENGNGEPVVGRRIVFSGLGALGAAIALAGCSSGSTPSSNATPASEAASGTELATTSEVPVGGGLIVSDRQVVITQPTAGTFVAFSALCTHENLPVTSVEDGKIQCARHGSVYSAETGEVERGPAQKALAEVPVKVQGTSIVTA